MRIPTGAYTRSVYVTLITVALVFAWLASSARAVVLDPGPPSIESVSVSHITSKRATLEAAIDPDQLETTYEFWVEYSNCQNLPPGYGECESITVQKVGEGHIEPGPSGRTVNAAFTHVQPEYSYTYWVVASNSMGKPESAHQIFKASPAPTVDSESVSGLAPNPIALEAQIDPNGQAVYYQFQLVSDASEFAPTFMCPTEGSRASSSLCLGIGKEAGALPISYLPAVCGPQSVSLDLDQAGVDLKVGSTYRYRVIVAPAVQTEDTIQWDEPLTLGAERSFTVGEDNVTPLMKTPPPGDGAGGAVQGNAGTAPIDYVRPVPIVHVAHSASGKGTHEKHKRHRSKASRHKRHRSKSSRRGHHKKI